MKDTTYADDDTTWIRDQVCEEKVSSMTGTVASDVQYYFGDDSVEQSLCTIGKGWPRESRAWLGSARLARARWLALHRSTDR